MTTLAYLVTGIALAFCYPDHAAEAALVAAVPFVIPMVIAIAHTLSKSALDDSDE